MTTRIGADGIGGTILLSIGFFFIYWTFYRGLPTGSAIVPRLAGGAIALGGFAIFIRDLAGYARRGVGVTLSQIMTAVVVLAYLSIYGWLMLRLGLASSIFLVLFASFLVLRARIGVNAPSWARPMMLAVIAAGVAGLNYTLFMLLLDLYLPQTLLF